jgi:hypothetical protein
VVVKQPTAGLTELKKIQQGINANVADGRHLQPIIILVEM